MRFAPRAFSRRRGFVLYEMVLCIALVALAMNIGVRLTHMILRSYREAPAAAQELRLQEQWLAAMRADAWQASDPQLKDGSQLALTVDDQPVVWRQEPDVLLRVAANDERRYPISRPLRWSMQAELLTVSDGEAELALATPARKVVPR